MPAKNNKPNHMRPDKVPNQPQLLNNCGKTAKPIPKPEPPDTILEMASIPKNPTEMGIIIAEPKTTSTNSFIQPAVIAFSAMSSFALR